MIMLSTSNHESVKPSIIDTVKNNVCGSGC